MTSGLEFGVNELPIDANFKPASIGRDKRHLFNLRFKMIEQIVCQAHGPVCIVSNSAVKDLDFHHDAIFSRSKNYTASWMK
jgi:hypothetical protein